MAQIPGSRRSPRDGHGNPLQYSCLENPRDGGDRWVAIYGAAQSDTTEATQQQQHTIIGNYVYKTLENYEALQNLENLSFN